VASSAKGSRPKGERIFVTTHWSLVLAAGGDSTGAEDALARLCKAYWYPLYGFVRRQGHAPHDAQDLTQEFFARLLEKRWLSEVERGRGRFRSWLLAAMQHFLRNEWHRAKTQRRGGGFTFISIDDDSAEARYREEPAEAESAERFYDRQWAVALLEQVMPRLRAEFVAAGKAALFEKLKFALSGEKCAYVEVARELGITEGAVKVAVHRLRDRYRALIRNEIAQTVATEAEIEDELRHLFATLS
jgi:RNA polymerase sigma-70 factor (ECF subfamily)